MARAKGQTADPKAAPRVLTPLRPQTPEERVEDRLARVIASQSRGGVVLRSELVRQNERLSRENEALRAQLAEREEELAKCRKALLAQHRKGSGAEPSSSAAVLEDSEETIGHGSWWERAGTVSGVLSPQQSMTATTSSPTAGSDAEVADAELVARATEARLAIAAAARSDKTMAQPAAAAAALKVGRRVRIDGLTNERSLHLNGTHATVLAWLPELGRWSVQLDGGLGRAKLAARNLKSVSLPRGRSRLRNHQAEQQSSTAFSSGRAVTHWPRSRR